MKEIKLPGWLVKITATVGGGGLLAACFLDSSFLTLPFIPDALLIELSIQRPARMPYYAAMAAVGSLAGCIWIYLLAKKGGEAYFRRHAESARARRWVERNGFLSVFVPGVLPPPMPFKPFILAAGVFQVPFKTFVVALLLGRGLRYFAEGALAVRYGPQALPFLVAHNRAFVLGTCLAFALLYAASRWFSKGSAEAENK